MLLKLKGVRVMKLSKIIEIFVFSLTLLALLINHDIFVFALLSLCGCLYFALSETEGLSLERKFEFTKRNTIIGIIGVCSLLYFIYSLKINFWELNNIVFQMSKIELITIFIASQFVLLTVIGTILGHSGEKNV